MNNINPFTTAPQTVPELHDARDSRETRPSAAKHSEIAPRDSKDGVAKAPIRVPICILRGLVLLLSLGLLILNTVIRNHNGTRFIAVSVPIAILCFVWSCGHFVLWKLHPSALAPTGRFLLRFMVDLILSIASFVCFGVMLQWNSRDGENIQHVAVFLGLLVAIAVLMTVTTILVFVQKSHVKQGVESQRFVQPPATAGGRPTGAAVAEDIVMVGRVL